MPPTPSREASSNSGRHDAGATVARPSLKHISTIIAGIALLLVLTAHLVLISRNLDTGHLAGHEFRQTQTALSILFIERDNDYGLAYPTPVFGPPWSIPMEFPLYQWISAKLVEVREMSVPKAGRLISLICFYLCLPAVYGLMRRFGFGSATGLWAVVLTLTTPVYIFYSRAVMIESMALLFCLWFLFAFDRLRHRGSWPLVVVTAALGTLAALTKITTFFVFGGIALVLGAASLWQVFRQSDAASVRAQLGRFALAGTPPLLTGMWWVSFSNEIKLSSPGGFFLVSSELDVFNLGLPQVRTMPGVWSDVFANFTLGVLPVPGLLILAGLIVSGLKVSGTKTSARMLAVVPVTVLCFPLLYRIHDYYFYAIAVVVAGALAGLTDRFNHRPRCLWITPVLLVAAIVAQGDSFRKHYWDSMAVRSNGGSPLFDFIRDATNSDEVLVVVGSDWSSIVPYFTQRRSVMIKPFIHDDPAVLDRIMNSLEGYTVAGLVVLAGGRELQPTVTTITERLALDPNPTFVHPAGDFHTRLSSRGPALFHFHKHDIYAELVAQELGEAIPNTDPTIADLTKQPVTPNQRLSVFPFVNPSPSHYRTQYRMDLLSVGPDVVLGAHADADFWVPWAAAIAHIDFQFGLRPHAFADEHQHSDGVWFRIWGVRMDESESLVWEKWLDPWMNPTERPRQEHQLSTNSSEFAAFRFEVRSGPGSAYDAAYWGKVSIR